jgi:FkbM family methyltransferase
MVSREEVVWAFRYCLGRDPESEETIGAHSGFPDWKALRLGLLKCEEYLSQLDIAPLAHKWVLTPVMGGKRKMWIDLGDRYVSRGCLFDNYEPWETAFVCQHLKAGSVFLDIGANIGWFTLLASTLVGETGSIVAFEPRPETAEHLRQTVEANLLSNRIVLRQCALADAEGSAFINSAFDTNNPGGSFVLPHPAGGDMESTPIAVRTLDSFTFDKVDFIKMDVEGSEMKVIKGGIRTIFRCRPIILSEINPSALMQVSGATPDDFLRIFSELNYEVSIVDPARGGEPITCFPVDWPLDLMNVAMIPK